MDCVRQKNRGTVPLSTKFSTQKVIKELQFYDDIIKIRQGSILDIRHRAVRNYLQIVLSGVLNLVRLYIL
jgi:hypothetical protein